MKKEPVLLVEDAPDMQLIVRATLGNECDLICAASLEEARKIVREKDFSLILLDVVLPDGSGFDFCLALRTEPNFKNTPIFFLTGEDGISQRVMGFDLGADDYIVKPFEPFEFKARVFNKLKRKPTGNEQSSFSRGAFLIDWAAQKATMVKAGERRELSLTPIEFKLLVQFLRNEGKIFSREELLVAVWGSSVHVSGHTVDTHISSLRKKVGDYASYFKAVVKKGYCYNSSEKAG